MIQQTSSKLPANVFKIHMNGWTFAGRLLDRVNPSLHADIMQIKQRSINNNIQGQLRIWM